MSRETKAGLLMILLLAGVFGFMVYKRLHHPAEALAEQNTEQLPDASTEQNSDGSQGPNDFAESTKIIHAAATEPARFPDDNTAKTAKGVSSREADPFADAQAPKVKPKLPTTIPDDLDSPVKSRTTQTVAAKTQAEFDPFSTEDRKPSQSSNTTSSNGKEADPFAFEDRSPAQSTRSTSTNASTPSKASASAFGEDESDPFAKSTKQGTETFEAPVVKNSSNEFVDNAPPRQTTASDPFDSNVELQAPPAATKKPAAVAQQIDESPFESKKPARPAVELQQGIDDAFDQPPAKSSTVPPLKIPSRDNLPTDNRSTAGDDRFGGFRPAATGTATANAFPDDRPAFPTNISAEPRRVPRPAPITQIDEDFAPRTSAKPLVAGDLYQIEPGDNYWTISRKKYGVGRYFMALAQHNSRVITDPKRMKPGVVIATPSAETLERTYPQLIPQPAPIDPVQTASVSTVSLSRPAGQVADSEAGFFVTNDGNPMYRVGSEDTLSGIAQRHLGRSSRWVQIFELNRDTLTDGNSLKIGAVLRLPADASRVEVVGGSRTFR